MIEKWVVFPYKLEDQMQKRFKGSAFFFSLNGMCKLSSFKTEMQRENLNKQWMEGFVFKKISTLNYQEIH